MMLKAAPAALRPRAFSCPEEIAMFLLVLTLALVVGWLAMIAGRNADLQNSVPLSVQPAGLPLPVIPAKLTGAQCPALRSHAGDVACRLNGIQLLLCLGTTSSVSHSEKESWIPAFAGMTIWG
jgi:hypothetical protein